MGGHRMHRPNRYRAAALAAMASLMAAAFVLNTPPASAEGFGQGSARISVGQEGNPGLDGVQAVAIDATGGTFTLYYNGGTSTPLAFDAVAGDVEAALVALPQIDPGQVAVAGGPGGPGATDPYVITLSRDLGTPWAQTIEADGTSLTGDVHSATVAVQIEGRRPADETQNLRVRALRGTYTLALEGQSTGALPFDATASTIQTELEALPNLDPGDVSVSGGPGDLPGSTPYLISFSGARSHQDVPTLVSDDENLATVSDGASFDQLPVGAQPSAWSSKTGQVAGTVVIDGRRYAWSWSPDGGLTMLAPSVHEGQSLPLAVNDNEQVAGLAEDGTFVWSAADGLTFPVDEEGNNLSLHPVAFNDEGAIVGLGGEATVWTPEGGVAVLGTLPTTSGTAHSQGIDINDAGQVIGTSDAGEGFPHCFSWTAAGGMVDLGDVEGDPEGDGHFVCYPEDLNGNGVAVGSTVTSSAPPAITAPVEHAFRWTASGGMDDLGIDRSVPSEATLVNDAGAVAGSIRDEAGSSTEHGFIWTPEEGVTALGDLGLESSRITVLGESGAVLGRAWGSPNGHLDERSFYWDREVGMVDLGNPADPTSVAATLPFALSETGEILAFRNLPITADGSEAAVTDPPVEIVFWPDAGPGQPDQTIRAQTPLTFVGSRVYNTTGAGQARTTPTRRGATATFLVRTANTGARTSRFTLRGPTSPPGFQVRYLADGRDVTRQITEGTFRTPRVEPQGHHDLTIQITVNPTTPTGRTAAIKIRSTNPTDPTRTDTAKAKITVTRR